MLNVFLKKELARLKRFPFITFRPNVCEYVPNGLLPSRHNNIINFKQQWKRGNFNSLENIFHKDYHSSISSDFFRKRITLLGRLHINNNNNNNNNNLLLIKRKITREYDLMRSSNYFVVSYLNELYLI